MASRGWRPTGVALQSAGSEHTANRALKRRGKVIRKLLGENRGRLSRLFYLRDAFRRLIPFRCVNERSPFETASDAIMIPSGAKHRFTNRSQKRAVIFNVYSLPVYPAGLNGVTCGRD